VSEVVEKVQKASIRSLYRMAQEVLEDSSSALPLNQGRDDILIRFVENMHDKFDELLGKQQKKTIVLDYESLSLVQEDELVNMVAIEGMISAARNLHLPSFISFNTRLNALFTNNRIDESTNPLDPQQISTAFSEALGPGDVSGGNLITIYRSFNEKILKKLDVLLRESNHILIEHGVIPNLGMDSATPKPSDNATSARTSGRASQGIGMGTFGTVEEDPYDADTEQPELFSMMQGLLRPEAQSSAQNSGQPTVQLRQANLNSGAAGSGTPTQQYAVPVSMIPGGYAPSESVMQTFQPAPGEQVQMVDQAQLMSILTNIQKTLDEKIISTGTSKSTDDIDELNISESLGDMLQQGRDEGVINAVDQQSSDVINLVNLLYDAIWQDESVPIPIKELIGRTQITIIKVALSDTTFFNKEDHPARMVLNDFAAAGIGWAEVDKLEEDPLYKKIQALVQRILSDYDGKIEFFENLVKDFRNFRTKEAATSRKLEQRILRAKERQERVEDIHELVTQKIGERALGRDVHKFVVDLLSGPFHKFMVMLVLKEGPGSNAWKQAINTIDVLLWSVQPHEHEGDKERLSIVNPRLLNNLRKAFRIAQLALADVDYLVSRLKEVQDETFGSRDEAKPDLIDDNPASNNPVSSKKQIPKSSLISADKDGAGLNVSEHNETEGTATREVTPPGPGEFTVTKTQTESVDEWSEDNPFVKQVDSFSVGVWVEFLIEDEQSVRCKLAAKINAIDKYIFVNRQGVKVVEKTRLGLAHELKDETVRMISDGLLFSRALESVIGNLRDSQHEQQTGSAYRPYQTTK
jgi:hypothetical protein